jgi:hypothetical protein
MKYVLKLAMFTLRTKMMKERYITDTCLAERVIKITDIFTVYIHKLTFLIFLLRNV